MTQGNRGKGDDDNGKAFRVPEKVFKINLIDLKPFSKGSENFRFLKLIRFFFMFIID